MSKDKNGLDPITKNRFEIEPLQNMNQKALRDCIESLSNVDLNGKVSPKEMLSRWLTLSDARHMQSLIHLP